MGKKIAQQPQTKVLLSCGKFELKYKPSASRGEFHQVNGVDANRSVFWLESGGKKYPVSTELHSEGGNFRTGKHRDFGGSYLRISSNGPASYAAHVVGKSEPVGCFGPKIEIVQAPGPTLPCSDPSCETAPTTPIARPAIP